LSIVGDAKDGLARLLSELGADNAGGSWDHGWRSGLSAAASPRYTVETARLIETLRSALPDDAIVVNDQTGINYWMEWRFPVLARAFGARGERVTVDTLPRALAEAFTADLPTVLELPMAVEPPWEL